MKSVILISMFLFTTGSYACDGVSAVREYYSGPEIQQLIVRPLGRGLYSVSYYDQDKPAHCSGGRAQVTPQCEVIPVQGLYCE